MKRVLIATMAVAILGAGVFSARAEGDLDLIDRKVWSDTTVYKNAYPTSNCSAATAYRYGEVIDCRRAQTIHWCVTTSSTNVTTYVVVGVEWLVDNPSDPDPNGPYGGVTYYEGFGLLEGPAATTATKASLDPWVLRELLGLQDDTVTTMATSPEDPTTASLHVGKVWTTGMQHFRAFTATKAPYCRPFVYYSVADTTTKWLTPTGYAGDNAPKEGIVRISAILRYKPWPSTASMEHDETKNQWYVYPWLW
jgi:hypothetical protein